MSDPTQLEHDGWRALCGGQDVGRAFYREVLAEDVTMLFPGGMRLRGKQAVLDAIDPDWTTFEIRDLQEVATGDTTVLSYFVRADRREGSPYDALISSVYVQSTDEWKLVLHQQTLC